MAVPGVAGVGDLAGRDVEGGEQAGDAVPGVVVGLPLGDARAHRQDRLAPLQGLALGLLVDADHDGVLGRVQVEADDVADLGVELRVGGELEPLGAVRLQAEPAPQPGDRVVADLDLLVPAQPVRQPPARPVRHAHAPAATPAAGSPSRTGSRAIASSVSTVFGPPGRGASSSPASPSSAYCRRHLITVGSVQPDPLRDLRAGQPLGRQQHDPGPLRHPRRRLPGPGPAAPASPGQHRGPSECARDSA